MIHAVIVEDDKQAASKLNDFLRLYFDKRNLSFHVTIYSNAVDFLSDYSYKYDVVFMDIEMPLMNGMEAAKRLRELDHNVCLIFVTNMMQYAVKGYEVDAIGYIVKPIDYFVFDVNMNKVVDRLAKKQSEEIFVKTEDYMRRIKLNDLYYVEVSGHYLIYHTTDGDIREFGQLSKLEESLKKHDFFRCNKCYLVNLKFVMKLDESILTIGNDEIIISRRRRKDFMLALNDYFGGF